MKRECNANVTRRYIDTETDTETETDTDQGGAVALELVSKNLSVEVPIRRLEKELEEMEERTKHTSSLVEVWKNIVGGVSE